MGDQFYQFLASTNSNTNNSTNNANNSSTSSLNLPLSFSLHHHHHHASFPSYPPTFDSSYHLLHPSQFLHRNEVKGEILNLHDSCLNPRSLLLHEIPWSNDELLALFRLRSSMDNTWFPDFIWENVSRYVLLFFLFYLCILIHVYI